MTKGKFKDRPARLINLEEIGLLALLETYGETDNSDVFRWMFFHGLAENEHQLNTAIQRHRDAGFLITTRKGKVHVSHSITPQGRHRIKMVARIMRRINFPDILPPDETEKSTYEPAECIADHGQSDLK